MKYDQRTERSTSRYQKARRAFLSNPDNALCVDCKKQGRIEAATSLDHITPVKDAPEQFWDEDNWQGLCDNCHVEKTAREARNESPERAKWREWVEGTKA